MPSPDTVSANMAKKKPLPPPTIEELKAKAIRDLHQWDRTPMSLIPPPTRAFEPGEAAVVGNLKDVVILEELHDGLAYLYSCTWTERDKEPTTQYRAAWWFDVEKLRDTSDVPSLFAPYTRHRVTYSDLSSIVHHLSNGGIVCDPRYQRGYVWTEANREALIESIFDRLDIGSFLFVRSAGYNHEGDTSTKEYRTLDGRLIKLPRCEDNTVAIIDGQQRLTTILNFMLGRWAYKGLFYSQMNKRDQIEFEQTSVDYRIVEEEQTNEKEIVRMFLQANRGVPQTPEHLAQVQALYDGMQ